MTWHYQIRKRVLGLEEWYDIIEVYDRTGWTVDGIEPGSETREGLITVLEMMFNDAKKYPTLVEETHQDESRKHL